MTTISEAPPVDPAIEPGFANPTITTENGETRQLVGDPALLTADNDPEKPKEPPTVTLTEEERNDFATLMHCGRRSKTITVMGHPVMIQTLTTADEMRVGLYTKPYTDTTLGFQRAYQVGVCAAGIREVQGKPLVTSLFETTPDELFDKKVEKVKELYPIVVTQVYQAIIDLEREFAELAIKLGKLSG